MRLSERPNYFISSAEALNKILETNSAGIIKTHQLIDLDWCHIPAAIPIVRISRNFKDSLISRALYVKNIRVSEGQSINEFEILDILNNFADLSDKEFINELFKSPKLIKKWLAEIVVMERGISPQCHDITYEVFMHNPYQALTYLAEKVWPDCSEMHERIDSVVQQAIREGYQQRKTFLRSNAVGIGGWETWLTYEQSEKIDILYKLIKDIAHAHPLSRWREAANLHNRLFREADR